VPYLGAALTEILDFRGKLKQNRLNQFTELLENYFSNHKGVNLENFQTVEFSDLFEAVLKRVVLTSSLDKLKMLKSVLVNQVENPSQNTSESEIFLDLISELTEIEIKILFEYREFTKTHTPLVNELNELQSKVDRLNKREIGPDRSELLELENNISHLRKKQNKAQAIYTNDYFGISNDQFLFCKQRLASKALLIDNGVGSIGGRPFGTMGITQFGIRFIDFIVTS